MTIPHIEYWARRLIERAKSGMPVEDARCELKADWIQEPRDAARRIAAQANAARGEPVLFLFGVDQKGCGVTGASGSVDTASWHAQVKSHFDSFSPPMHDHAFEVDGKTVVALQFDTEGAPFVVKTGQSQITHEVPWREGTAMRSANRGDLLRILVPEARLPEVELLTAGVRFHHPWPPPPAEPNHLSSYDATIGVYVTPRSSAPAVIPFHRCSMRCRISAGEWWTLGNIGIIPGSKSITVTGYEAAVYGPGLLSLVGDSRYTGSAPPTLLESAELEAALAFTGTGLRIPIHSQSSLTKEGEEFRLWGDEGYMVMPGGRSMLGE